MTTLDRILRGLLAVNFALFILSFIPAFRLWSLPALDGWRLDFVWVCASTVFVVVASIPFIAVGGVTEIKERRYHRTAILCLVWIGCFLFYFVYNLLNSF